MKDGRRGGMKRLQIVLKQIMLRRRKDDVVNGKPLIELPGRSLEVVSCEFSPSEKQFYDSLAAQMNNALENIMNENTGKSNYMSVLLLLLRLRQGMHFPIVAARLSLNVLR